MGDTEVKNRKVGRSKGTKNAKIKDGINPAIDPRDEGDGESTPEAAPDETVEQPVAVAKKGKQSTTSKKIKGDKSKGPLSDLPTLQVTCNVHVLPMLLFAAALATRFYNLDQPNAIVFDELHYGRYAGLYMKQTFFFDSHPPLGKQLLALSGYLAGFQGDFKFDKIGAPYNSSVPVFAMRSVPALTGSLLIPLVYMIMLELSYSQWTAALAGFLFLFDNALLTQSHYMLMEPILLFFALSGLFCVLKFRSLERSSNPQAHAYTLRWWGWLLSGAFLLTCSFCVKYVGVYSYLLGLALVGYDFWEKVLGNLSLSRLQVICHFIVRCLAFIVLPVLVYTGVFYIHLTTLINAGPHDSAMSSAFQASLEGGLSSIVRGQPLEVVHGSQVTLRHTHGSPCWLHSHDAKYPIKYADKRGSSHQQQVTCYPSKDMNNWWIVKRPNRTDLAVAAPLDKISHGEEIQLVHGMTGRTLNSHNVAAPSSPTKQEISCYIDHNVSMPAQDIWRVEITNREEVGDVWHALESMVRLVHVSTNVAMAFSGRMLPEWANNQFEIVGDVMINQPNTIFNVEEHRYTRNEDERDRQMELMTTDFIPLEPVQMNFWEKFLELQVRMLFISNENVQNHMYTSSPWEWLVLTRGIAYWVSTDSNAQIHLLGNVFIWYSATVALAVYCALLVFYLLRQRRQCYDIHPEAWNQFCTTGEVLLLGYTFHFLPYFFVDHTLFLHHYLPALVFQLALNAALVEHLYYLTRLIFAKQFFNWMCMLFVGAWMFGILLVFQKFLPLSYGTGPMNATQILDLKLRDTWDFIIHKP
nr:EOG090X015P [Ilyocryptus agilis]